MKEIHFRVVEGIPRKEHPLVIIRDFKAQTGHRMQRVVKPKMSPIQIHIGSDDNRPKLEQITDDFLIHPSDRRVLSFERADNCRGGYDLGIGSCEKVPRSWLSLGSFGSTRRRIRNHSASE